MAELKATYETKQVCPVCNKQFIVTKVRSKFLKLKSMDSDFCPHYETINPIFYEAWVCEHCGYSAHSSVFSNIDRYEAMKIKKNLSPKWTSRSFSGERDWNSAMEAFKLVLYNLQVREAKASEFGKICLRIAWLYRYTGESELEKKFLGFARDYYEKAYSREVFPIGNLDMFTCLFIIGELYKRTEDLKSAMKWLGILSTQISKPENKGEVSSNLLEKSKEAIYEVRKMMKKRQVEKDA